MPREGRFLEILVQHLETFLAVKGISVTSPEVFYKDGNKIGEIDITLRGDFGSSRIFVGIECRDRPSDGPQGSPWIAEIHGKQRLLRVDKMIAVSRTGFTPQAVDAAEELRVNLLTLEDPTAVDLQNFISLEDFEFTLISYDLREGINIETVPIISKKKLNISFDKPFLKRKGFDKIMSLRDFIRPEVNRMLADLDKHEGVSEVDSEVVYPGPDCKQPIRAFLPGMQFYITKMKVPVTLWRETVKSKVVLSAYKRTNDNSPIALTGISRFMIRNREFKALVLQKLNTTGGELAIQFLTEDNELYLNPTMQVFMHNLVTGERNQLKRS